MKRVLMLVDNHVRDDPRVMPEAISLVQAGYRVSVIGIAIRPNLPARATVDGVDITLVPMGYVTLNPVIIVRGIWNWLRANPGRVTTGIPANRTRIISILIFYLWVLRVAITRPVDMIHSHDVILLPVGWLLARLRRIPIIYDSHENAAFITGRIRHHLYPPVERWLLPRVDAVITVGDRLARALEERGAKRVVVIGNWKREGEFTFSPEQLADMRAQLCLPPNALVVSYMGLIASKRSIEPLLEAVRRSPEVHLVIAGKGPLAGLVEETAESASNIHWLGWVGREKVALCTAVSDVIFYCLASNTGNLFYSTPNKLFEAFAAGKALIARQGTGEIGEILEQIPAAILLDSVTVENLQWAFMQLQNPDTLKSLQDAAFAARNDYNWAAAEAKLKALYEDMLCAR